MKRNEDAHCFNCPYFWHNGHNDGDGVCRVRSHGVDIFHGEDYWCGEHPEFELKEDLPDNVKQFASRHRVRETD